MKGFYVYVKKDDFESPVLDINTIVIPTQGNVHGSQPKLSIMSFLLLHNKKNELKWYDMNDCQYHWINEGMKP